MFDPAEDDVDEPDDAETEDWVLNLREVMEGTWPRGEAESSGVGALLEA
jgi:hypothetical protein